MLLAGIAEALAGSGIVEFRVKGKKSHGLHDVDRAVHDTVDGLYRLLKRQPNRRLSGKIEDQNRPNVVQHRDHAAEVAQHDRMKRNAIIDAESAQSRIARNFLVARCSMNIETVSNQELCQIGAVLAGRSENECGGVPGLHGWLFFLKFAEGPGVLAVFGRQFNPDIRRSKQPYFRLAHFSIRLSLRSQPDRNTLPVFPHRKTMM